MGVYRDVRVSGLGRGKEKHMENNVDNEMESGLMQGFMGLAFLIMTGSLLPQHPRQRHHDHDIRYSPNS